MTGELTEVCQKAGCWMVLKEGEVTARILMKDHGFTVPMDVKGKSAIVEGTLEIAARIAAHSPLAIWGTKEAINYTRDHSVADSLRHIAGWQSGMFVGGDMMEEFAAKAEGRSASFEEIPSRPEHP